VFIGSAAIGSLSLVSLSSPPSCSYGSNESFRVLVIHVMADLGSERFALSICKSISYASTRLIPSLSVGPSPPSNTWSQNSDVPWGPMASCRKVPLPKGVCSALEKCSMLCYMILSCILAPSVMIYPGPPWCSYIKRLARGSVFPVFR